MSDEDPPKAFVWVDHADGTVELVGEVVAERVEDGYWNGWVFPFPFAVRVPAGAALRVVPEGMDAVEGGSWQFEGTGHGTVEPTSDEGRRLLPPDQGEDEA